MYEAYNANVGKLSGICQQDMATQLKELMKHKEVHPRSTRRHVRLVESQPATELPLPPKASVSFPLQQAEQMKEILIAQATNTFIDALRSSAYPSHVGADAIKNVSAAMKASF